MSNPFRYGREVDVLVDRTREVNTVVRIGQDAGTLFLIGPRRFGKTSVLKAAEDRLVAAGAEVSDAAIDRILTMAEDVPYNVQQLASQCWTMLHGRVRARLTPATVEAALREILATQHATYMQRWLSLTTAQKQTLKIVTAEPAEFQLAEVARRHGVPRTTMQRALQLLEERSFVRQEVTRTGMRWRIEDPFFIYWLHDIQEQ